jgi:hypothetical protein
MGQKMTLCQLQIRACLRRHMAAQSYKCLQVRGTDFGTTREQFQFCLVGLIVSEVLLRCS